MAEIADKTVVHRASTDDATPTHAPAKGSSALLPLADIPAGQWRALAEHVVEPNAYYLPEWALAVSASARGRMGALALSAFSDAPLAYDGPARMIGLLPVVSLWRAYKIPLPALVTAQPYGTLCTPPLDCDLAEAAAERLMLEAGKAGAHALVLRDMSLDGKAMRAFTEVLRLNGMRPRLMQSYLRACLDATRNADELLLEALGAKKLKELRRLRHRLAENGTVRFEVARTPAEVAAALETFLVLEASGWKGKRGTALAQHVGDAAFIRRATAALAETGQCEIVTLRAGDGPVAAAILLRHQDRAFYFKLGIDERFAKYSPGVQLTLDLTRHLCSDPAIRSADSTAAPDHPMINPIWRGRFAIGDVLIPLRRYDPLVPMIHTALAVHRLAEEAARGAVRFIRSRGKSP
ncbi:GNAT family N-acetyltransferase [Bradyrhizobium cenepequi]|uniref:GNAT family N-acetyltransferase n=1 Tax=Bradyrhizobium cenepequi TaxID=2821403 RepID=UPI001CE257BE|nr:GNAT family N-acetyltransferase [Bradyrhizobium cenepequi]MCA6110300.1 GNAT family N-acetyltransferase [Bradyrhizobium cenepequi]